ncbi:hypothetical protein PROFUN_00656 [Planoprotostelium fungivorum]|uniref:Uncharacterized protein n=1 Tax=Planoprotostelium fungivorum TaxID=1890364 RepID=A0A2P6NTY9_9EUKA|nr:hypothetical protein PROFUN_00656 [Planoprotostelium fungivorum]
MREKNSRIIIGPDRTRIQSQLDCNDDTFNHAYQRVLREWWERWQEHLNKREPHPTLYVAPLSERAYQSFSAQQLLEWYVRNVDDVESGVRPTSEDRQLLRSISGWNDKQIDTLFRRAHNQLVPRVTQAARGHKDESNGIAEFFKEYLCGTVTQKRKRRKTTLTTQSVRDIMDTIYHSSQWSLDVSQDELLLGICSSYEQSEAETIRRRQRKFGLENRVVITNQDIHAAKMLGRRDSPTLHHIRVYHALEAFIPMRIILRDRLQSGPFLKTGTFIIGSMPYDLFEAFLFRDGTIGDISDQKGWRWIEGKRDETHRYVFKFKQGGFPLLGQAKDCNLPWWERYYQDRNKQITKHYYTEVDFRICSKTFIVWASCTFESRFQDKVLSNAGSTGRLLPKCLLESSSQSSLSAIAMLRSRHVKSAETHVETTSRSATITTGFCLFLCTLSQSHKSPPCLRAVMLNGVSLWRGLTKPSKRPREFLSACLKIHHNSSNYYPLKDVIPFMALEEELIGKILLPAMEKYFEQIFQQMRIDGQFTPTWGLGDNTQNYSPITHDPLNHNSLLALMSPQLPSDLSPTLFLQTSPDLPSCMVASIPDTLAVSPTQVVSPFSAEIIPPSHGQYPALSSPLQIPSAWQYSHPIPLPNPEWLPPREAMELYPHYIPSPPHRSSDGSGYPDNIGYNSMHYNVPTPKQYKEGFMTHDSHAVRCTKRECKPVETLGTGYSYSRCDYYINEINKILKPLGQTFEGLMKVKLKCDRNFQMDIFSNLAESSNTFKADLLKILNVKRLSNEKAIWLQTNLLLSDQQWDLFYSLSGLSGLLPSSRTNERTRAAITKQLKVRYNVQADPTKNGWDADPIAIIKDLIKMEIIARTLSGKEMPDKWHFKLTLDGRVYQVLSLLGSTKGRRILRAYGNISPELSSVSKVLLTQRMDNQRLQKQSIHDAIMRPNHVRYTLVPDIKALNAIAFLWDCHDGEDITNPFCPMCKCDKERIGEFKCQEEWGQRTLRFRHWELTCDIMVCALHAKQRYVEGLLRYILTTFPQTSETFVENMRKISGFSSWTYRVVNPEVWEDPTLFRVDIPYMTGAACQAVLDNYSTVLHGIVDKVEHPQFYHLFENSRLLFQYFVDAPAGRIRENSKMRMYLPQLLASTRRLFTLCFLPSSIKIHYFHILLDHIEDFIANHGGIHLYSNEGSEGAHCLARLLSHNIFKTNKTDMCKELFLIILRRLYLAANVDGCQWLGSQSRPPDSEKTKDNFERCFVAAWENQPLNVRTLCHDSDERQIQNVLGIRSGEEIVTDDNGGLVLRDQEGRTRTLFGKKASFIQVDASVLTEKQRRQANSITSSLTSRRKYRRPRSGKERAVSKSGTSNHPSVYDDVPDDAFTTDHAQQEDDESLGVEWGDTLTNLTPRHSFDEDVIGGDFTVMNEFDLFGFHRTSSPQQHASPPQDEDSRPAKTRRVAISLSVEEIMRDKTVN